MSELNTAPNFKNPDDAYAELLRAHDGLSEAESAALNMKLVLLLANHIGDLNILVQALAAARKNIGRP